MVQRFSLDTEVDDDACVLTVRGEVDIVTSPQLVVAGRDAVRAGAQQLTVDLRAVTFMDSSGVAALINLHRAAARLRVVCHDGPVRRLFALTATERVLGVEAVALERSMERYADWPRGNRASCRPPSPSSSFSA
jgi:anti-sigma B factor antagonist